MQIVVDGRLSLPLESKSKSEMQYNDLKSPSKTEINYARSRELEKNRYFVGKNLLFKGHILQNCRVKITESYLLRDKRDFDEIRT